MNDVLMLRPGGEPEPLKTGPSGETCMPCGKPIRWMEAHTRKRDRWGDYAVCMDCVNQAAAMGAEWERQEDPNSPGATGKGEADAGN